MGYWYPNNPLAGLSNKQIYYTGLPSAKWLWHFDSFLIQSCLVPIRRLSKPSWSMHFGDASETNGWETPRQSRSAHA